MTEYDMACTPAGGPPADGPDQQSCTERLQVLESQVRTLAEAVRALAKGLDRTPAQESEAEQAARGARLAHELLLLQGL